MSRIWYIFIGVCLGLGLAVLAACGSVTSQPTPTFDDGSNDLYEDAIVLKDGRTITCVVYEPGYNAGGLSCDFGGTNE